MDDSLWSLALSPNSCEYLGRCIEKSLRVVQIPLVSGGPQFLLFYASPYSPLKNSFECYLISSYPLVQQPPFFLSSVTEEMVYMSSLPLEGPLPSQKLGCLICDLDSLTGPKTSYDFVIR